MVQEKGMITAHFIRHWGVPEDIHPRKVAGIGSFAVREFAPKDPRKTWRYATNGMSSYVQAHPDPRIRVRTELFACTAHRAAWIGDLLVAVARYPLDCSTYLAEGDTIDVGQPIDRDRSSYTSILLAPPGPFDAATVGLIGGLSENVLVHQVVGLVQKEIGLAQEHGGMALWQRIVKYGEALLDEGRISG
jgi:hypothetical protein